MREPESPAAVQESQGGLSRNQSPNSKSDYIQSRPEWPARSLERRRVFQALFHILYEQILHGCGNPLCRTSTCATYRKGISQKPFRPYTALSARALAAHLISEDHPSKRICPYRRVQKDGATRLASNEATAGDTKNGRLVSPVQQRRAKASSTLHMSSPSGDTSDGFPSKTTRAIEPEFNKISSEETLDPSPCSTQCELLSRRALNLHGVNPVDGRGDDHSSTANRHGEIQRSQEKDQLSLSQNVFDTAAMKLLLMIKIPNIWGTSSNPDSTTGGRYHAPDTLGDVPVTADVAQEPVLLVTSKTLVSSSISQEDRRDKQVILEHDVDSANSDSTSCNTRSTQKGIVPLSKGHAPRMPVGDELYISACECCEYTGSNGQSVAFCIPQYLIDWHCMPLISGTALNLAVNESTYFRHDNGHTTLMELTIAPKALGDSRARAGGEQTRMRRYLGRTDRRLPVLQCKEKHNEPHDESLINSAQLASSILSSSDALLRFFLVKSSHEGTSNALFSADFGEMISDMKILHDNDLYPQCVLSSLWQSAEALYLKFPGRVKRSSTPSDSTNDIASHGLSSHTSLGSPEIVHLTKIFLAALVGLAYPVQQFDAAWLAVQHLRKNGQVVSNEPMSEVIIPRDLLKRTVYICDALGNEMAHSIIKRLTRAVASHNVVALFQCSTRHQESDKITSKGPDLTKLIVQSLTQDNVVTTYQEDSEHRPTLQGGTLLKMEAGPSRFFQTSHVALVVEWLRGVLLKEWDGKAEVDKSSSVGGALTLLSGIYDCYGERDLTPGLYETPFVAERLDVLQTPVAWMEFDSGGSQVHLFEYPFLFRPSTLVSYFRAINHAQMSKAFYEAHTKLMLANRLTFTSAESGSRGQQRLQSHLGKDTEGYLILNIRREDVLNDAFDQLWRRKKRELLRPLKVRLGENEGEEGLDHGGVQQEFIRIAISEALEADYGAFTTDPTTRMSWFQPGSLEPLYKFELLGLLMALAVYNGLTLPWTFPIAFYMKLLNHQPDHLEDIVDGWPDLAKGLRTLRDWTGDDVEEVFCRSFDFSVDVFGTIRTTRRQKAPSAESSSSRPAPPMVDNANRHQYITEYVQHLTLTSIQPQFEAFERGVKTLVSPKALSLFTPHALQVLVEGVPHINTHELERATEYIGGYDPQHRVIRDFWSVVHSWATEDAQGSGQAKVRQLLEFVTASDRLPAGGEARLSFVVQKNGVGDARLPTSLTCFGRLLLPEYSHRHWLKVMLEKAIENARGFGSL